MIGSDYPWEQGVGTHDSNYTHGKEAHAGRKPIQVGKGRKPMNRTQVSWVRYEIANQLTIPSSLVIVANLHIYCWRQ